MAPTIINNLTTPDLPAQDTVKSTNPPGGKYLIFRLAREEYGVPVLKVREIIGLMEITRVPQMPDYVKGVINLRGKVIPVIDLRRKFGLSAAEYTDQTCVITIDADGLVGIIVDSVQEVADIRGDEIEPPPPMGTAVDREIILGLAKSQANVRILLDIDRVLAAHPWKDRLNAGTESGGRN